MADGIGCKCFASYQGECACDADWTPSEVYELKAHINDLREALEIIVNESHPELWQVQFAIEALSKTPAQILQSVINEAVEKVETILIGIDETETESNDGWWETSSGAKFGAEKLQAIRALKAKP